MCQYGANTPEFTVLQYNVSGLLLQVKHDRAGSFMAIKHNPVRSNFSMARDLYSPVVFSETLNCLH